MMYNIRSGAIQWKMPEFISEGNSNDYILERLLVKMGN